MVADVFVLAAAVGVVVAVAVVVGASGAAAAAAAAATAVASAAVLKSPSYARISKLVGAPRLHENICAPRSRQSQFFLCLMQGWLSLQTQGVGLIRRLPQFRAGACALVPCVEESDPTLQGIPIRRPAENSWSPGALAALASCFAEARLGMANSDVIHVRRARSNRASPGLTLRLSLVSTSMARACKV